MAHAMEGLAEKILQAQSSRIENLCGIGVQKLTPVLRHTALAVLLIWTGRGGMKGVDTIPRLPRVLCARPVDQGALPGAARLREHRPEDPALG